jgi:hypothetical protein
MPKHSGYLFHTLSAYLFPVDTSPLSVEGRLKLFDLSNAINRRKNV